MAQTDDNRFKIRRGASIPTNSNLYPYEMGFNKGNQSLYISDDGAIVRLTHRISYGTDDPPGGAVEGDIYFKFID